MVLRVVWIVACTGMTGYAKVSHGGEGEFALTPALSQGERGLDSRFRGDDGAAGERPGVRASLPYGPPAAAGGRAR